MAYKGKVHFRKMGNMKSVYIDGLKDIPQGKYTEIVRFPDGYAPKYDFYVDKNDMDGNAVRLWFSSSLSIRPYGAFAQQGNFMLNEFYF